MIEKSFIVRPGEARSLCAAPKGPVFIVRPLAGSFQRHPLHYGVEVYTAPNRSQWWVNSQASHPNSISKMFGERLVVQEPYALISGEPVFKAHAEKRSKTHWIPARSMPEELSRFSLKVQRVTAVRLKSIKEELGWVVGVEIPVDPKNGNLLLCISGKCPPSDYLPKKRRLTSGSLWRAHLASFWDQGHGKRFAWATNPRVALIEVTL